jgi:uncharacterized protein YpmS
MKKIKLTKNLWKWLFFILLTLNIASVLLVVSRIFVPRESNLNERIAAVKVKNTKVGSITTTRDELNGLINSYLQEMSSKSQSYKFYLADSNAVLQMNYKLFSKIIPIYVYFQPAVTSDGSILLTVQSVSAGTLNMPTSAILDYAKIMKLPAFVEVNSDKSTVRINLSQLALAGNLYFKAGSIDMTEGIYIFDIYKEN